MGNVASLICRDGCFPKNQLSRADRKKIVEVPAVQPYPTAATFSEFWLEKLSGDVAVRVGEEFLTYADLRTQILAVASSLRQKKLNRGDCVAIVMNNCIEFIPLYYGIIVAGGVCAVINPAVNGPVMAHGLMEARAKFVMTYEEILPKVQEAIEQIVNFHGMLVRDVFVKNVVDTDEGETRKPLAEIFAGNGEKATNEKTEIDDIATFSPTTDSLPKYCLRSQKCLISQIWQLEGYFKQDTLVAVPLWHGVGMTMVSAVLQSGKTVVLPEKDVTAANLQSVCKAARVPEAIVPHSAADFVGALPVQRLVVLTQASFELWERQAQKAQVEMTPAFGTSEGGILAIGMNGSWHVLPHVEVKVETSQGVAEPGTQGAISVRAPQAFLGYANNVDCTMKVLGEDGFLRLGVRGCVGRDGRLSLSADLYAAEVALLSEKGVQDAAVLNNELAFVVGSEKVKSEGRTVLRVESIPRCPIYGTVYTETLLAVAARLADPE